MWQKIKFDPEAPLFTQFDMGAVAGISQATAAKWLHRKILEPTRPGRGQKGGHLYSAIKIFEIRTINSLVQNLAIPPTDAAQMAHLAANGDWKFHVIKDHPHPHPVFLVFNRTENRWSYDVSMGPPTEKYLLKYPVVAVLPAARDLMMVYEECLKMLNDFSQGSS
jgi:hypothetical protein